MASGVPPFNWANAPVMPPPPPKREPDEPSRLDLEPIPIRVRYLDLERCCFLMALASDPAMGDIRRCQTCGATIYWVRRAWSSSDWVQHGRHLRA
jgi:hypothetical protein